MSFGHLLHAARVTLRISVPTIIEGLRGTLTAEVCDERLAWWSRELVSKAEIELRIAGAERVPKESAFVVMSNHQSHYDIPVLYQSLPLRLRMVAKSELFRIPIWAQAMRAAGFVEVDRGDRERAIQSLERARAAIAKGTSIWIAPEGTRSRDGALGPFKLGGFHLAVGAHARILPVTISGTRRTLPAKGSHVTTGSTVNVTVHQPIEPANFGAEVGEPLIQAVRSAIESAL
ncbi:MAG TPA: lysophospholipid acyltransferase family protein [Polyangiaceae bacterium]|jgi:1-acyl-sn-glycerol-3-phosphate acyltransferase|nr:lysophospholipid acyltransferase family protein [Polyangiaceae bacterium]